VLAAAALAAVGLALLALSGDRLVEFAAALGLKARLGAAVVGLTIVAAGTSMPELFVSVAAALAGSPAIAVANVVGSNIANVGLILGLCALLAPVPVQPKLLRFEYPFMVLASWIALLLVRDGLLDRLEAGFFVASMVAFLAFSVWAARAALDDSPDDHGRALAAKPAWLLGLGVVATLVGLALGAELLVHGAVIIAERLGVSERVIGLTVVAVGTSLPELAASLAASLRGRHEIAVTNVVGSNVFNLLMILGWAGLVRPLEVAPRLIAVDLWAMVGIAAALFPLVVRRARLSRAGGAVLLALYVAYLAFGLR
jgi:cation:H+ antiporter